MSERIVHCDPADDSGYVKPCRYSEGFALRCEYDGPCRCAASTFWREAAEELERRRDRPEPLGELVAVAGACLHTRGDREKQRAKLVRLAALACREWLRA